jgi:hypothetical protein
MTEFALSSGMAAAALSERGVRLSPSTIQRYAREGRVPYRQTPGGRYRFNLAELQAALSPRSASETLSMPVLTGGLGSPGISVESEAYKLRSIARRHITVGINLATPRSESDASTPSAMHGQIAQAARCSLAFA